MEDASKTKQPENIQQVEQRLTEWLIGKLADVESNWDEMCGAIRVAFNEHRNFMVSGMVLDEAKKELERLRANEDRVKKKMRPPEEVMRAHDILLALIFREVNIELSQTSIDFLKAQATVLCWLLNCDHGQGSKPIFQQNLENIEAEFKRRGIFEALGPIRPLT